MGFMELSSWAYERDEVPADRTTGLGQQARNRDSHRLGNSSPLSNFFFRSKFFVNTDISNQMTEY